METNQKSQARDSPGWGRRTSDLITPNPKLKLLDQVREVMRLKHYSIRKGVSHSMGSSSRENACYGLTPLGPRAALDA